MSVEDGSNDWNAILDNLRELSEVGGGDTAFVDRVAALRSSFPDDLAGRLAWAVLFAAATTERSLTEDTALELGDLVRDHADDADDFTIGYKYAFALHPNSDRVLRAIVREAEDNGYVCEDAIELAAQKADDARARFLRACALLLAYHTGETMTDRRRLDSLLRAIDVVRRRDPAFGLADLEQADAFLQAEHSLSRPEGEAWEEVRDRFAS